MTTKRVHHQKEWSGIFALASQVFHTKSAIGRLFQKYHFEAKDFA
jgi:hypothetical protein